MFFLPEPEVQPCSRDDEPSAAIHVESLVRIPAEGPGRAIMFLVGELAMVWEHVRRDVDQVTGTVDRFRRKLGRFGAQKGIPGSERSTSQGDRHAVLDEPVEDHGEMGAYLFQRATEVMVPLRCSHP